MLIATFNSDAWQVAYTVDEPSTPGGQPLPLTACSQQGTPIPIAVPESLLDQEALVATIGQLLAQTWGEVRPGFTTIPDAAASRFAHCLPRWLHYAGGGL